MEKLEKIEILNNKPRSTAIDSYLTGIYYGEISENDEMFQKISQLLKERCDDNKIDYNEDVTDLVDNIFDEILQELMIYGVTLEFTKISNFENEFINHMNAIRDLPNKDRVKAIDVVVNENIHNPMPSIMSKARKYIGSKLLKLHEDLLMLMANKNRYTQEELDYFDSIFGVSAVSEISEEDKKEYKDGLEFFLSLPKFSLLFETRLKYNEKVNRMRSEFLVTDMEDKYPEYINALKTLTNHVNDGYTYYYHGAPSVPTAQKIINEGLFMQYGEIDRTAKCELTVPEIIEYAYGHDGVGRDAMVVIAVPDGENPVYDNIDESVVICGTGQGYEQGNFNPKYVIPSKYIIGYIDKSSKMFVANPKFSRLLSNGVEKSI